MPLFISGPGVPRGAVSSFQANFIDLAPTILALAGMTGVRQAHGMRTAGAPMSRRHSSRFALSTSSPLL